MTTDTDERERILDALATWIAQRPGLEFGNYGSVSSYRAELRSITKDLHHARTLLQAVRWRESITAEHLKEAFRAYSGRLSWDGQKLSYCTGQYWLTEYRRAVCAVLASALWGYARANMPKPERKEDGEETYQGKSAGDYLRSGFRKEYGRAIADRWFN